VEEYKGLKGIHVSLDSGRWNLVVCPLTNNLVSNQ
jgi:hypothetical protein